MTNIIQEIVKRIRKYQEQTRFYKQVEIVIIQSDQYLKIKTINNKYEFYRGTSTIVEDDPSRYIFENRHLEKTEADRREK